MKTEGGGYHVRAAEDDQVSLLREEGVVLGGVVAARAHVRKVEADARGGKAGALAGRVAHRNERASKLALVDRVSP